MTSDSTPPQSAPQPSEPPAPNSEATSDSGDGFSLESTLNWATFEIPPKLRAWLELCRLPNVFTAMADPLAGALIVGAGWRYSFSIVLLMLSGAVFYAGGVVLNDWHDFKKDLSERPHRPLPSKRIARWKALGVACGLLALGVVFAAMAAGTRGPFRVSLLLLIAIVGYDILLKNVPVAPGAMGLCRGLNLLMGMSLIPFEGEAIGIGARTYLFVIMTAYITGVTIFASKETMADQRKRLMIGTVTTLTPVFALMGIGFAFGDIDTSSFGTLFVAGLLGIVGFMMLRALLTPDPPHVQKAVKTAVLGVVVLDAAMVALLGSAVGAVAICLLLIPAIWLGKWVYST